MGAAIVNIGQRTPSAQQLVKLAATAVPGASQTDLVTLGESWGDAPLGSFDAKSLALFVCLLLEAAWGGAAKES